MDNRLKIIRKFKGLTQNEVAKILNTTQSQYGKYENGKTSISTVSYTHLDVYKRQNYKRYQIDSLLG